MSKTQNENQTNSASLDYSEENFTDYSIKVIECLCKRYKKAVTNGQPTEFNIDEIWFHDLKAIIGNDNINNFHSLLMKIRETTRYSKIQGNIVRLAEGRKTICAEVGIELEK